MSGGRGRRAVPALLGALACLALAPGDAATPVPGAEALGAPPDSEALRVAGLTSPVDILIDRYGVPHIYAGNEPDLFFAQGFNVARDRLFQLDLWRRRGRGELAAAFGPDYVEEDRAARLFLYRGDMAAEWASYGPDAEAIASRFAAGINAYIDFLGEHPERLPPEFRRLDYAPARWSPEDVVAIRSHALSHNLDSEVARARTACAGSLFADRVRQPLTPRWRTHLPQGLDPCLPKDVLHVFELATQEFRLRTPGTAWVATPDPRERAETFGSNNWAIGPAKSSTGRPVLANDPHRDYVLPSIRYLVDLEAPTLHAIGANEAHLPGISIGHNDRIAFGYTIFRIDQEDLYAYRTRGSGPGEYRYRSGWEKFRVVHEEIAVRGQEPVPVELRFTRHGAVIWEDPARGRAYAVKSAWSEPGTAAYMGALRHLRAASLAEFEASLAHWGAPALNHVYADVDGTIAWQPAGFAPRRPNWDGLLPVPGDGRFEWSGRWALGDLPRSVNPDAGYVTTSNEMNLPAGYPNAERKLGFEWTAPWRHRRLVEMLEAKPTLSIDDSLRMQNDIVSLPARRVLPVIARLRTGDPDALAAQHLLGGWSGTLDGSSGAAALYEVWMLHHLRRAVKDLLVHGRARAAFAEADIDVTVQLIEHPREWLRKGNAGRARDELLATTLAAAYRETRERLGADDSAWRWSALHHNTVEHPLSAALDAAERAAWSVGPIPKGGDGFVPNMSAVRSSDFRQTSGPSIRLVLDVGHWDESWAMNFPGQSGDPRDIHFRDLAAPWLNGEYFPLYFTRAAVERVTERTIRLLPR